MGNKDIFTEHKSATKAIWTHPNRLCATYKAFIFRGRKIQLKLHAPYFVNFWSAHDVLPWQSACVLGFGGRQPAPNETFCVRKGTSRYPLRPI